MFGNRVGCPLDTTTIDREVAGRARVNEPAGVIRNLSERFPMIHFLSPLEQIANNLECGLAALDIDRDEAMQRLEAARLDAQAWLAEQAADESAMAAYYGQGTLELQEVA